MNFSAEPVSRRATPYINKRRLLFSSKKTGVGHNISDRDMVKILYSFIFT
jgi:hypothetical protein